MRASKFFSKKEKIAIVRAFFEVSQADGEVCADEWAYVDRMKELLGLKPRHGKKAAAQTFSEAKEILAAMSSEKMLYLSVMLQQLAEADGVYDENEQKVILEIFRSAGVNF